jgi:hypothetical protein
LAQSAPGGEPVIVAVWALADGDTPVEGGRVRVYAAGRVVPQRNGRRQERTYGGGDSLLEFSQLPRQFVVEVAGGGRGSGISAAPSAPWSATITPATSSTSTP